MGKGNRIHLLSADGSEDEDRDRDKRHNTIDEVVEWAEKAHGVVGRNFSQSFTNANPVNRNMDCGE